jgi:two-component sensor histidine kinase
MLGGKGIQYNPILRTRNDTVSDFNEAYDIAYDFLGGKLNVSSCIDSTRQVRMNSADPFPLREWHHVVLAYDDDSLWLYLDGHLESSVVKGFRTRFYKDEEVFVGITNVPKNERYLCGSVDDIVFFDHVLTPEEVMEVYSAPDPNRLHAFLKWALRALLVLVIVAGLVWLFVRRSKRDLANQKEKNTLLARLNEVETKAIRMQMNPHFIFNSLNTMQRFLLEEDIPSAQTYLIQFAGLLRKLIESSESETISLADEIDILKNYVEIEQLRFESKIACSFVINVPSPEKTFIPFMMIQPLVENAIWHGLTAVKGEKQLKISFSKNGKNCIACEVNDNGPGFRQQTLFQKLPKKKSVAMDFIRQRLVLLEKVTGTEGTLTIHERKNDSGEILGTSAIIEIPIMN